MGDPDGVECSRCVMRAADDPDLTVIDGICNHCRRYDELLSRRVVSGEDGRRELERIVRVITAAGRGRAYDCVIGVSGGTDSTYVALLAKRLGLRPLAVHVDNGWNSETAVANIQRVLDRLDIDLHTVVLDLREFYDLQRSFLDAGTPDGDIPADHAIQATLWRVASERRIRFILSGMNFRTESISVRTWTYGHSDWRYIRAVHRAHGKRKISSYPHFGLLALVYYAALKRIRIVSPLNYVDFDKDAAQQEIRDELGWEPYGGKHFESVYTRFYQGFVLPTQFGIDKRRGHYSDLINSGLASREEALRLLEGDTYPQELLERDRRLVQKKLGLTEGEVATILGRTPRSYSDYPNSYERVQWLRRTVNRLRGAGWYPK